MQRQGKCKSQIAKMQKLQIAKLQKMQNCKVQIVNREIGGREHGQGSNTHGQRPCEYYLPGANRTFPDYL